MKVYYNTLYGPVLTVLDVSNQKKAGFTTIDTGPRYVYFLKVLYFLAKLTWYLLYCLYLILHTMHFRYIPL